MSTIKSVSGAPSPYATWDEKVTDEYGLKIGALISSEWFNGSLIGAGTSCAFLNRRNYVREKRLFVRGEQDTQRYKDHMARGDNGLELLNLDWSNINLVEKFCRIVSNGISDDNYKLSVECSDRLSVKLKEQKFDEYRKDIYSKKMLQNIKKNFNIDLTPKGFVPEDEEEMQLWSQIKDRPKIEIFEETMIDFVKETSNWSITKAQNDKDIVDLGLVGARIYTDKHNGVTVSYVDPEHYVHSPISKHDFSDKFYEGVVETITLSDLRRESDFTEIELRKIAQTYASVNKSIGVKDFTNCSLMEIIDIRIDVLRFAWKTSKTMVYKKKLRKGRTIKLSKRNDQWKAPKSDDVDTLTKTLDTWFEGNYIIGANAIYGYQECENIVRDKMNKAMSPFVFMATDIYENRPQSFLTKIETIANQMQDISLQIQHHLSQLKPDIIEIDLDMLAELDDGKTGVKRQVWQVALDLLQVKGVVFKKRIDMGDNGGIKEGAAVKPSPTSQGSAIAALLNAWAFKYNIIRDITGVNPARDGSLSADALLGVNQLAQLASNTATKHIVDTSVEFHKKVCEVISTRLHGIFKHKDAAHLKEIYINAVGKHFVDAMEVLADRHLHEFGFTYKMFPTSKELEDFNADLSLGLTEGSITPEVKIEATRIARTNIKLATEYLLYHRRKSIKQKQEEQIMLAQNKSQNDAMAARSKIEAEVQAYEYKKSVDLKYKGKEAQIDIMREQALMKLKEPIENDKFEKEVYLKQIEAASNFNLNKFREDRKDDRTKIQASQQSQIADQRKKDSGPIDFENNFDFANFDFFSQ